MENQVFVFGSFSEDEASQFQFSYLESPTKQTQAASSNLSIKENGFPPSHSDNIGTTIFLLSTDLSEPSVQRKASQRTSLASIVNPPERISERAIKFGKLDESPLPVNSDGSIVTKKGNHTSEVGSVLHNGDELSKDVNMEQAVLRSMNGAALVGERVSVMQPDLTSGNQGHHEIGKVGNVNGLTSKVDDFVSETIPELNSRPDAQNVTSSKLDSETPCINPDVDIKGLGNGTGMPVSLAENIPKTWAARLGVQPDSGLAASTQKSKGKVSSLSVFKSSNGNAKVNIEVTEVTGESWLRSLNEVEASGKRMQPRGLINTGNLCFLNATLQALLSCTPFVHLLRTLQARGVPQVGYPTLQAFVDFFKEFQLQHDEERTSGSVNVGKPFVPSMFDDVLKSFRPQQPVSGGGRNRQEDAQEFLSFTMDHMHEELLRLEGKDQSSSEKGDSITTIAKKEDDWETVGPRNRTAVIRTHTFMESALSDIFGGQLCSVVKTKGIKASATVQPFLLLHLDILPEAVYTVEDALKLFAAPESLEGYKTTAGKAAVVSASKSVKLQSLPRVLILHLMRFSYGARGISKLHKPLRFPFKLILGRDLLANTTSSGSEVCHYELVTTVTHHGKDPSRGHYTADSRQSDGQWLRYDDGMVSVVGPNRVLQDQAYLLFYKRLLNAQ